MRLLFKYMLVKWKGMCLEVTLNVLGWLMCHFQQFRHDDTLPEMAALWSCNKVYQNSSQCWGLKCLAD